MGDFLGALLATFVHPAIRLAGDIDADLADLVHHEQRKGTVADHVGDAGAAEAFGGGLRVGGLALAGEPAGRGEVRRAGDAVDARELAGAVHLDVAQDEYGLEAAVLGQLDQDDLVADGEADAPVDDALGGGDAGGDVGAARGGSGGHEVKAVGRGSAGRCVRR